MAFTILDSCTACGACEEECPREAISAGDEFHKIDPDLCNECADLPGEPPCLAVCPIDGCIERPGVAA